MDHRQIDRLARSLVSRRSLLAGIPAVGLSLLGAVAAAAHNPLPACKRINDAKRRRACLRRARAHHRRHRRQEQPRKPDAFCDGQPTSLIGIGGGERAAQTFTEPNGGELVEVELIFARGETSFGHFLLQVHTVDPATGYPTNNTIASSLVPRSAVRTTPDLVQFAFDTPATLVAGRQYALVLSHPAEGSGTFDVYVPIESPGRCPGGAEYFSGGPTSLFGPGAAGGSSDFAYYATTVRP